MSGRRYGSDKEVAAVTFNMKEQRCLEKSLQTLTLEKAYSLKLLDLNHRIIRVNYRRLKDRVSKIRSNLSADDITQLRQLEANGKLKPSYNSVNISGALKIAAAARRLKFERPLSQRSSSAHPRLASRSREGQITPAPNHPEFRRSNSVTGAFIDAPIREDSKRRISVDVVRDNEKPRPFSAFTVNQSAFVCSPEKDSAPRPATTAGVSTDKHKLGVSRPTTGGSSNGQSHGHAHSPFSSHSLAEKDARVSSAMTSNSRGIREVRSTYPSDDSIDDNLGEDLFEERRQEMLDDEFTKAEELELKKEEFLRNIDEYLRKTTALPAEISVLKPDAVKPGGIDVTRSVMAGRRLPRRRQMRVDFDQTPTYMPESDYRRRLLELWKDINRCRYLRVPEELIDLSGIATLAKDQMRLFEVMRQAEPESILASAEL